MTTLLHEKLKEHFGFEEFRQGQKEVIQSVLNEQDTLAMLPTGTGKSLCYQLPGYLLNGPVIIVSPLLSLMQDQVEQMKVLGEKRVVALNSFLTFKEKKEALKRLHSYRFIFISPEMLFTEKVLSQLRAIQPALYVVDEAHCISQWGPDFRPDYLKLGTVRNELGNPVTLALTATASESVRKDIKSFLGISPKEIVHTIDRPNIAFKLEHVENHQHKLDSLLDIVQTYKYPGIIYFSSKKMTEDVAAWLREQGIKKVGFYHGGMDQEQRTLIQQQFLTNKLDIICATSAFGMGINKPNIRFVVHFHLPLNLEAFIQEIGRAGRDGKQSISIVLYNENDIGLPIQIMENELPNLYQIDYYVKHIVSEKKDVLSSLLQLSDTQQRFIEHYLEGFQKQSITKVELLVDRIYEIREERLRYKRKKLNEVISWIETNQCRREKLLHVFNESIISQPEHCCDTCGLVTTSFMKEEEDMRVEEYSSWEERLKKLLIGLEYTDES